jgi:hypothetical protein
MSWHTAWLWTWFYVGMTTYWLKRAYYGIAPPNPVATGYVNYLQRAWAPLLVRAFIESLVFWILFTPGLADRALAYMGWQSYGWAVQAITQVAPMAAAFGHTMDSIADMAVSKIPGINTILPQMPGPLPKTPTPTPPSPPASTPPTNPTPAAEAAQ